jgi:phage-related protein
LIGAVIGVGPGELMNQIAAIPEFIRTIVWPPIKNAFASLLGDVVKIGGDILGAIGRGIVAAVKLAILTNPVLLVIAFIIGEIIRYWPQLLDIGGKVLGKIGEGILAVLATIQTIGGQVIQAFIDAAVLIFGPIVNLGRNIVGKIIEGITVVWDTISPIAGGVIGRFVSGLGDIWGMMVNVGRNIINGIINGIQALWWYITNIAAQIWGVFANSPLGRAASYAADWGYNLIKGFADGISNAWHWLKQIFDTIVNYVRNNPAVKWMMQSPSRLYKKYGENLMEGLEQGITAGSAGALASFNDVVDSITNAPIAIPNINGLNTGISSNQPGATTGAIVRNVTYNIQPGQMIASKGEVRNFVRMLNDYQRVEEERLSSGGG